MKDEVKNMNLLQACFPHFFIQKELEFKATNPTGHSFAASLYAGRQTGWGKQSHVSLFENRPQSQAATHIECKLFFFFFTVFYSLHLI